MPDPQTADPAQVLEQIRANQHSSLDAGLVAAIYELEHQDQFEDDRGPTQAKLRDLIIAATASTT
jgi:hypothetical protein